MSIATPCSVRRFRVSDSTIATRSVERSTTRISPLRSLTITWLCASFTHTPTVLGEAGSVEPRPIAMRATGVVCTASHTSRSASNPVVTTKFACT